MFFSLATCFFFVSRKMGVIAYLHAFFIVCLPLIYFGVHFPTDIFAGALIGCGIASLFMTNGLCKFIREPYFHWIATSPGSLYPCLFVTTLLMATQFDSARSILVAAWKAL